MKKVRLFVSALTRVEYSEVVEVADDITDEELSELTDDLYESTDGGEFHQDNDYWERGSSSWEDE